MSPRLFPIILVLAMLAAQHAAAGDPALGRRIYREGILPSGQPLTTVSTQPGVTLSGRQAACIACHRRSGFGGSEGPYAIRPITQRYLFQGFDERHPGKTRGRLPAQDRRPPYTAATLARALSAGADASGRAMDGIMPRYALADADLDHLAAYLGTLSAAPDPGVTETTIHFATIVDAAADPEQRQAMLEILETFFRDKSAGTRLEGERARRAPWDMAREYEAYRKWQLHVWTLEGPPETWGAQLEANYRAQPVFAVLSGIGAGVWQPVHDFCERSELPCLFPNVDQPPQTPGQYALYLTRGLAMEAEALAVHLERSGATGPIVQVCRDDTVEAGRAFGSALAAFGLPPPETRNVASASPDPEFWRDLVAAQPAVLVLWLKSEDLAGLVELPESVRQVFLSARLVDRSGLPAPLAERAALVYPWELPQRLAPRLQRLHAWLKMKRIPPRDDAIQANTFFAVSQAGMEIAHLVDDFSRDYFIERIEHGLDNTLAPSVYPRPSLGPGQRYASKGSYIVKAAPDKRHLEPLAEWIVPDFSPAAAR